MVEPQQPRALHTHCCTMLIVNMQNIVTHLTVRMDNQNIVNIETESFPHIWGHILEIHSLKQGNGRKRELEEVKKTTHSLPLHGVGTEYPGHPS